MVTEERHQVGLDNLDLAEGAPDLVGVVVAAELWNKKTGLDKNVLMIQNMLNTLTNLMRSLTHSRQSSSRTYSAPSQVPRAEQVDSRSASQSAMLILGILMPGSKA